MRISDWSSDVCSSDLSFRIFLALQQYLDTSRHKKMDAGTSSLPRSAVGCRDAAKRHPCTPLRQHRPLKFERLNPADRGIQCKFRPICLHIPIYRPNIATSHFYSPLEIGTPSCRERVCQSVEISVGAGTFKK